MIDFGVTVPSESRLKHDVPWELGNHEDGYLTGLRGCSRRTRGSEKRGRTSGSIRGGVGGVVAFCEGTGCVGGRGGDFDGWEIGGWGEVGEWGDFRRSRRAHAHARALPFEGARRRVSSKEGAFG
eukprot:6175767-Pleurochrysis_carterae.AAC.1